MLHTLIQAIESTGTYTGIKTLEINVKNNINQFAWQTISNDNSSLGVRSLNFVAITTG